MTRRRWQALTAGIMLLGWTVVYLAVITFSPPAYDPAAGTAAEVNFGMAVMLAIPATVYVLAALLLLHFWLAGPGATMSEMDGPERLLATAIATLPEHRREWGAAMTGELADVEGRGARWGFAFSCARAALLPRPGSWPVLALMAGIVVAATVTIGPAAGTTVPGLEVFAASFVGLAGALALLALARPRRLKVSAPAGLVIAAVAAAIALTAIFLVREPGAAAFLSPAEAVLIAAVMAAGLRVALVPPRSLGSSRLAPRLGVGVALAAAGGQLLLGRIINSGIGDSAQGWRLIGGLLLIFGPAFVFFVPAFWAAMADRSLRAGLKAGVWTAIAYLPLIFTTWLYEAMRGYAATGKMIIDVDPGPLGGSLDQTVFYCLVYAPVVGIPCAVFGAVMAAYLARQTVEPNPVPSR